MQKSPPNNRILKCPLELLPGGQESSVPGEDVVELHLGAAEELRREGGAGVPPPQDADRHRHEGPLPHTRQGQTLQEL